MGSSNVESSTSNFQESQESMTSHNIFQTINCKEVKLVIPYMTQVKVIFNLTNSANCRIINSMNSGPFNEPNTSNSKEYQMMSKDESLVVRVIPFKFKFSGLNNR